MTFSPTGERGRGPILHGPAARFFGPPSLSQRAVSDIFGEEAPTKIDWFDPFVS